MERFHRIPRNAIDAARALVVESVSSGGSAPDHLWRLASGVATKGDLADLVGMIPGDLLAAAASASRSVDVAEILSDVSEAEAAAITTIAAMIDFGWERALQQAAARAKVKLAKSMRRDELTFDGWPNAAVATYIGADGLIHGQFELLAQEVAAELSDLHARMVDAASMLADLHGVAVEAPQDRSDEVATLLLAVLRAKAMAYMTGQLQSFDPSIIARNVVAYVTYRSAQQPDLLDIRIIDASAFSSESWVEAFGSMFGGVGWSAVWRHAFYRVPDTPFAPHVAMNGRVIDASSLPMLGVWPGDHPFCTCALVRRWFST